MVSHGSATVRSKKPHVNAVLKQRAESLINNKSIDGTTRNVLGYALEINDPLLEELVGRVESGEGIIDEQGHLRIALWKLLEKRNAADLIDWALGDAGVRSAARLVSRVGKAHKREVVVPSLFLNFEIL